MKLFIVLSLIATALFAGLTYRPVDVCDLQSTQVERKCDEHNCITTTYDPIVVCHPSHQ